VQRSKELPFGGRLTGDSLAVVRHALREALNFARASRPVAFAPEARELWIEAYSALSRGESGMFGAATARAEAHTVRLALQYALLDRSETIEVPHLRAALAFWAYSARSSRWVFGDSLGDPTADEIWIMAADRADGVSRTEVSNLFSRNKKSREIDRALNVLRDAGRLERRTMVAEGGRPAEIWVPIRRAS
jgi:hypothetical protein